MMAETPETQDQEDQTGAPPADPPADPPENDAEEELVSPRAATIDSILEARNEMLKENGVDIGPPDDGGETATGEDAEETAQGAGEDPPAEGAREGQDQAGAAAEGGADTGEGGTPREDDPNQQTFKVVVDGQEREVTRDELIRGYQIERTARERMKVANETLERVDAMERRLLRGETRAAEGDTGAADGGTGTASSEDPLDAIDFKAVAEALQYKDSEEASQVLKGLVKDLQSQSGADPAATYNEVETRILDRIEWDQATDSFRRDYPDICENPHLATMTAQRAGQIWSAAMADSANTGTPRPRFGDIWNQAGNETRAFVEGLVTKQQGGAENPPPANGNGSVQIDEQRLKDKRDATPPPKPRAVAPAETAPRQTPEEVDLAKRRSDAIADMQKARGQSAR